MTSKSKLITLKPEALVRLPGWHKTIYAHFNTVRAAVAEYSGDPEAAFRRAVDRGHPTAFINYSGTTLSNSPEFYAEEDRKAATAVTLEDGQIIEVEGEPEMYMVRVVKGCYARPVYSDPIKLVPIWHENFRKTQ